MMTHEKMLEREDVQTLVATIRETMNQLDMPLNHSDVEILRIAIAFASDSAMRDLTERLKTIYGDVL